MPRYYMHLQNDQGDTPDLEGVELPDQRMAERRAIAMLRELIAEDIRAGRDDVHLTLTLCTEDGRSVRVTKAVARVTGLA